MPAGSQGKALPEASEKETCVRQTGGMESITGVRMSMEHQEWMGWLKAALPLADRISVDDALLERICAHAEMVRGENGWEIPDAVFLPFVLFPRVNNEDMVFYHGSIHDALKERIRGKGMTEAAQEVNRWCFEKATYASTDIRTANALTVIRRGFGRCGEESVLLVSALRACGIPARQIYVPFWSHCDDNHAWVEAWVNGAWHYMGACEPEVRMDSGWFTAAASKAMMVHTRSFGMKPMDERVETEEGTAYVINRTAAYARTRLLTIRVTESGKPVPGLQVLFQLANMGCFRDICRKRTDGDGIADILTGLGTVHVHVTDGERFLETDADVNASGEVCLDFAEAASGREESAAFLQRPPLETSMQPVDIPEKIQAEHEAWMAQAEQKRQAHFRFSETMNPLAAKARDNRMVIGSFLNGDPDRQALLESLSEKDLADVTLDVLMDALETALPYKERYPYETWVSGVLCPRISTEMLYPIRREMPKAANADAVWAAVCGLEDTEMQPETVIPDLRGVLRARVCSEKVRDILFVAICRANGIAAILDGKSQEKMIWESGGYRAYLPGQRMDACLVLRNMTGKPLQAEVQFSVSVLRHGRFEPLDLEGQNVTDVLELPVHEGFYRVMTCARRMDGSVEGMTWTVRVKDGETREICLQLPEDRKASHLLHARLPLLHVREGIVRFDDRPGIFAMVSPGQEPTEHFLNELMDAAPALEASGIAVRLVLAGEKEREHEKIRKVLGALPDVQVYTEPDMEDIVVWRRLLHAGELRLPLAVAVDQSGQGLFAFVNYHVGSVMELIGILNGEEAYGQ